MPGTRRAAARQARHPAGSAQAGFLCRLPDEILLEIFRDSGLDYEDLGNLRLTCRMFSYGLIASLLFHTAHLSKFRCDLDSFLGISSTPQLALHVKTIVWHEVRERRPAIIHTLTGPDRELELKIANELMKTLSRIDWLQDGGGTESVGITPKLMARPHRIDDEGTGRRSDGARKVLPLLHQAVAKMKNVQTLVSRPVDPTRRLISASDNLNYPLTAQVLGLGAAQSKNKTIDAGQLRCRPNWGFYNFLLQVACRGRSLGIAIKNILFADEDTNGSALLLLKKFRPYFHCATIFEDLESLDLCISPAGSIQLLDLAKSIREAEQLTFLSLCFENGVSFYGRTGLSRYVRTRAARADAEGLPRRDKGSVHEDSEEEKRNFSSCSRRALRVLLNGKRHRRSESHIWKHLRELRLSHCVFPMRVLANFMARNAHSLKKLHFTECGITWRDILTIAKLDNELNGVLELQEFKILDSAAGDDRDDDCEFHVNNEYQSDAEQAQSNGGQSHNFKKLRWVDEKRLLKLLNSAFLSRVVKSFDTPHISGQQEQNTDEDPLYLQLLRVLDSPNRRFAEQLWAAGLKVTAYTHFSIFDSETCHSQAVCDTRQNLRICEERYGREEVARLDRENGEEKRCPLGYSLVEYLRGPDEVSETPRSWWVVRSDSRGVLYAWREHGDEEKEDEDTRVSSLPKAPRVNTRSRRYRTEVWRFFRQLTNEYAFGAEPLEYWEDWGLEGDIAEETPFGYRFRSYVSSFLCEESPQHPSCPDEYIRAHDGVPVDIRDLKLSTNKEFKLFKGYVNRFGDEWFPSETWTWSNPGV